jgi:hypothetical protein
VPRVEMFSPMMLVGSGVPLVRSQLGVGFLLRGLFSVHQHPHLLCHCVLLKGAGVIESFLSAPASFSCRLSVHLYYRRGFSPCSFSLSA